MPSRIAVNAVRVEVLARLTSTAEVGGFLQLFLLHVHFKSLEYKSKTKSCSSPKTNLERYGTVGILAASACR